MEDLVQEKKLKITVFKDVKSICQEAANKINLQIDKSALHLIAELAWKKSQHLAIDLESFAKHAKRTTINPDDVKLSVRHNEKLKDSVSKLIDEQLKKKTRKSKEVEAKPADPEDLSDVAAFE